MIHPAWSNGFADIKGIFCPLGVPYTPSSTVAKIIMMHEKYGNVDSYRLNV